MNLSTQLNRGREIQDHIGQYNIINYATLDDNDNMLEHLHPRFVKTDPDVGLTERDCLLAIELLNCGVVELLSKGYYQNTSTGISLMYES